MIRVLVAEDMHLIRGALVALLSLEPDMTVVAELDRGDNIVEAALQVQPDVAVLDIDLPGLDGLSAAEQLHHALPDCQTLILTGLGQPGNLLRALRAHVRGFIVKDAPAASLADGIRKVVAGERVIDPDLVSAALETGASPNAASLSPLWSMIFRHGWGDSYRQGGAGQVARSGGDRGVDQDVPAGVGGRGDR
jgi:two-component system response regulator DesR